MKKSKKKSKSSSRVKKSKSASSAKERKLKVVKLTLEKEEQEILNRIKNIHTNARKRAFRKHAAITVLVDRNIIKVYPSGATRTIAVITKKRKTKRNLKSVALLRKGPLSL